MTIQEMFQLAADRYIPDLKPMPPGRHLNLGQGYRQIGDAQPLDLEHGWDADKMQIPAQPETITGIWANGFFEHVENPVAVLRECQRVLVPGGILNIVVPHGLSDLWAEDVTHVKQFTEASWRNLFRNAYYDTTQGDGTAGAPWLFNVHCSFIMGVVWRNLLLFTQLIRVAKPEEVRIEEPRQRPIWQETPHER